MDFTTINLTTILGKVIKEEILNNLGLMKGPYVQFLKFKLDILNTVVYFFRNFKLLNENSKSERRQEKIRDAFFTEFNKENLPFRDTAGLKIPNPEIVY